MLKCRACLKSLKNMIPFDENIVLCYNLLTNLNIELSVKVPQQLCKYCYKSLQQFIEFRNRCILANSVFNENTSKESADYLNINEENMKQNINKIFNDVEIKIKLEKDNHENIFENENSVLKSCAEIIKDFDNFDDDCTYELSLKTEEKSDDFSNVPIKLDKMKPKKKYESKPVNLPCGLCHQSFDNLNLVSQHLLSHKKNSTCAICSDKFVDWQELLSHRIKHLPAKQNPCHLCTKKFKSPLYLEHHYRKLHSEDQKTMIRCKKCSRSYSTPKKIKAHIRTCHSSKTYICDYCSKIFSNKPNLKLHIPMHMELKPFSCDMCEFTTRFSSNLRAHKLYKHTPKKAVCRNCTRAFACQLQLDKHKCTQTSIICPVCGKILKAKKLLNRHMQSHEAAGRYRCERCGAAYRSRAALAAHCDKHDGVRRHRCEHCPASFYFASVLIKHRRTHTGIKPYVCRICEKGFTGNHNLKMHMRVHGEYLINKRVPLEGAIC